MGASTLFYLFKNSVKFHKHCKAYGVGVLIVFSNADRMTGSRRNEGACYRSFVNVMQGSVDVLSCPFRSSSFAIQSIRVEE